MATYYVDPAGSNTSPYDTWTKAATSLQTIADIIVAGEVCYCRGHIDLAAAVDFDTAASTGSNAAGYVRFIGCNASGTNDGTYFTLHCNGQSIHGINANGNMDMVWLENFEIYGSGAGSYDGINMNTAACSSWVLNNCSLHDMGRHGLNSGGFDAYCKYIRCTFYNNGNSGTSASVTSTRYWFCSCHDNVGDGMNLCSSILIGCIIYDNGDDGVDVVAGSLIYNCVVDQNADDGLYFAASTTLNIPEMVGCRVTNQSGEAGDIGFNPNSEPFVYGWNYIFHNGDNIANDTIALAINMNGSDTNTIATEDSGNVDTDGYTSVTDGAEDYNLSDSATLRRTAVTIPTA